MNGQIKRISLIKTLLSLIFLSFLIGCEFPSQGLNDTWRDSIGVQILVPEDGSQWHLGEEIEVTSRVSAPNIVRSLILYVNGEQVREDLFFNPQFFSGTIFQKWTPKNTGIYTLQTRLMDASDKTDSNIVTIQVVEGDTPLVGPIDQITMTPNEVISITPTLPTTTLTSTLTPTITLTVTPTQPEATGNVNLNCRLGPGLVYETVWYLMAGQTVPLIGRSEDSNWLVVQRSDNLGRCWVSASYVTTNIDIGDLTIIEAPPIPPTITFTPLPYYGCSDYPDFATCSADPMGFGTCSWNTGLNVCE